MEGGRQMLTGLSFSRCVRDIIEGRVSLEQVAKITANTAARNEEEWIMVFEEYKRIYWEDNPEEAVRIARELIRSGRVNQPRLQGKDPHSIIGGHWLNEKGLPVAFNS